MATQPSLRTGETPRKDSGYGPGRGRPGGNGGRVFPTSPTGSAQDIHRAPPHSVEAEQGVLGSMLISPRDAIAEVVEKITADYFYVPAHQTIFDVLVDLWNTGAAIDLITFTQVLRDRNLLETVGGAALVTSLYTFVPTAANVGYYLEIVRDKYILRSIIAAGTGSDRVDRETLRTQRRHHRSFDWLYRIRPHDERNASLGNERDRGATEYGQDRARHEHCRARRDQRETAGRRF